MYLFKTPKALIWAGAHLYKIKENKKYKTLSKGDLRLNIKMCLQVKM